MKVWWCEEHDASAPHDKAHCWYAVSKMISRLKGGISQCRVVEMQLAPLDARIVGGSAIVIERDAGWPLWLTEIVGQWGLEPSMFLEDLEDAYTERSSTEVSG